jgi:hypothetical protein
MDGKADRIEQRRNDHDVTGRVRVSDPVAVETAVVEILQALNPDFPRASLTAAFERFGRLYAGRLPGFAGCDTWYHDAQHSLDVALATARLIDGYERGTGAAGKLGSRRAVLGVICALFHDVGYVRQDGDTAANGAAYTLSHVERSGAFLERVLPQFGFSADEAAMAHRLIHFTGYEVPLDSIQIEDSRDRQLGFLIATGDLLAQTADRCYLEKCRDFLYPEFLICGLAGERKAEGPAPLYPSIEALLHGTPEFNAKLWHERLDGYFGGVHRHLGTHFGSGFGGRHPYVAAIDSNLARVQQAIDQGDRFDRLRRRPQAIQAQELCAILDGTD